MKRYSPTRRPAFAAGRKKRSGVILLVVLSSLTFFSLLVVSYFVFSSQAQQSAFGMNVRTVRAPDTNGYMETALMTLLRGKRNGTDPFFGEGLMDDYWGHDGVEMEGHPTQPPQDLADGFARLSVQRRNPLNTNNADLQRFRTYPEELNDLYAGRLITFEQGPLRHRTFQVLRSIYRTAGTGIQPPANYSFDDFYIEIQQDDWNRTTTTLLELFYGTNLDGSTFAYDFHLNGVPQNSPGLGFNTTSDNLDQTLSTANLNQVVGFSDLPVSLQPNHNSRFGGNPDKNSSGGDFDEDYDAPDSLNWFLSYRHRDGTVIPSFHRPSVINYILNQEDWSNIPNDATGTQMLRDVLVSLSRATMRPIPLAADQLGNNSLPVLPRYTGGSGNFALRSPVRLIAPNQRPVANAATRLHLLSQALINDFDVDNDGDGRTDSIFIDVGLPIFTSREGKLLRPLIAPMIEDLSGRLNINAVGNQVLGSTVAGTFGNVLWAGTQNEYLDPNASNRQAAFRGIGYGPADISIPAVRSDGTSPMTGNVLIDLNNLVDARYGADGVPGGHVQATTAADGLDIIQTGWRPRTHTGLVGYGRSLDPFGHGGVAIGRSGDVIAANSGTVLQQPTTANPNLPLIDEALNDPYEFDPTGLLSGDSAFTLEELEAILRANDFDTELLPGSVRDQLLNLIAAAPEFSRSLTTSSRSSDAPTARGGPTTFLSLYRRIRNINATITPAQVVDLLAPELRLGRKLDINRAFGNGVDENNNRIVDEPLEDAIARPAFSVAAGSSQVLPNTYQASQATRADYLFDATGTTSGRELLARHLYVLVRLLTDNAAPFPSTGVTPIDPNEINDFKNRRLAQWAVNVVDYRDPDSIMTRFAYDPNPFDGWAPSGTAETTVWGVESPNLLLSEGLALHDTRLRDIAEDGGDGSIKPADPNNATANDDDDSDQVRRPEGSVFLELYCPHPTIKTRNVVQSDGSTVTMTDESSQVNFAQEVFDTNGELVLNRLAPSRAAQPATANTPAIPAVPAVPVYRIAFSEPHYDAGTNLAASGNETLDPATLRDDDPDLTNFAPETRQVREIDPAIFGNGSLEMERFAFFSTHTQAELNTIAAAVADMASATEVFFAPDEDLRENNKVLNADRTLQSGQFLVIAPREVTHLGSQSTNPGGGQPLRFPGEPSSQRFDVNPNFGLIHSDQQGNQRTPTLGLTVPAPPAQAPAFTPALPIIIAAHRPGQSWTANAFEDGFVGLNISEPPTSAYYTPPAMEHTYNGADNAFVLTDAYLDFDDPAELARDTPEDVRVGGIIPSIDSGIRNGREPRLGTINNFCTTYLQRLADPTLPYDSVTNPYRTIDWMTIDLTVFNGEDRDTKINQNPADYATSTRQRNGFLRQRNATGQINTGGATSNALYSLESEILPGRGTSGGTQAFFSFSGTTLFLQNSFSFLNTRTDATGSNPTFVGFSASLGSVQSNFGVSGNDRNLPQVPYALHPWLNRPFASELELLMVPACSQSRLLEEFSFIGGTGGNPEIYPTGSTIDPLVAGAGFRHLLNFFHSSETSAEGFQLTRLFDFVGTLPRFRGEVDFIAPGRIAQDAGNTAAENALRTNILQPLFATPFNFRYDNSRVGRVNLNTLSEFPVWAGLMQGHMTQAEFNTPAGGGQQLSFDRFQRNRRGYDVAGNTLSVITPSSPPPYNYAPDKFDDRFPTQFAGLYRDSVDAQYSVALRNSHQDLTRRRGVEGTVLRALDGIDPSDPTSQSLFVRSAGTQPQAVHQNRERNPFVRYQTAMRMPNLVSDNSQMFLIRMTMGFFEVDATDPNGVGREYNAEVGLNERYRAMFIVDRSKPIGFKPGEDLNVRDAVIYESYDQ